MASTINASTSAGLVSTADTSGVLQLQTAGTTAVSIDASQAVTFSAGTANGVSYLNGSKVLTTGSALAFDGSLAKLNANNTAYRGQLTIQGGAADFSQISFYRGATTDTDQVGYLNSYNTSGSTRIELGARNNAPITFSLNDTEQMRLTSTGLGIGTSSPGAKLNISGSSNTLLINGSAAAANFARFTSTGGDGVLGLESSTAGAICTGSSAYATLLYTVGATSLQLGTNSNVRATLDSSGNCGFGGKVPDAWTNSASVIQGYGWSISTNGTNSNSADFTSNAYRSGGTTSFKYEGSSTATNYKQSIGEHQWFNAPSGTAGNAITFTQAMTLDASGNLLVGATSLLSNANYFTYSPGNSWGIFGHANGTASGIDFIKFYYNNTQIGSISQNGTTAVLYNITSDQRLKENIQDAESASDLIDAIQVRKFNWKSDGSHQRYGFVAQELVAVAPEAVNQPADPDEMMAVDYSKLVPMLVKEIQSLRIRIAQLEAK